MHSSFYIKNPHNTFVNNTPTSILKKCDDTLAFHSSLPGYKPTPLVHLPNLSNKYNVGNIYIKDE